MNKLKLLLLTISLLGLFCCLTQYFAIREPRVKIGQHFIRDNRPIDLWSVQMSHRNEKEEPLRTIIENNINKENKNNNIINRINSNNNSKSEVTSTIKKRKLIMISLALYNAQKNIGEMRGVPFAYNFTDVDGTQCPVSNCEVTYNRSRLDESDAVLFDGRIIHEFDIKHLEEMRGRSRQQIWLWMMHESPQFTYYNVSDFDGFFNWSMTYRPSSDIYAPYFGITRLREGDPKTHSKKRKNFADNKDKKVLAIISHCTDYRMNMIRKLKQFIDVDLYGACKDLINPELPHCQRGTEHCITLMQRYKFYLAIENGYCEDYVTEKYYKNGLIRHIVPILLNGGNYSNTEQVFLPDSYINIEDFKDMKSLGEHLNYLDQNDTAYNGYHDWRFRYRVELKNGMCNVCKALWEHDVDKERIMKSQELELSSFWSKKSCISFEKPRFQKYLS